VTAPLVGPLPTIRFWDGTRVVYDPPRNTLDLRYVACRDHHPACDCREGLIAEDRHEFLVARRELSAALDEVLAGHRTYSWSYAYDWRTDRYLPDDDAVCMCTGCQIARRVR
jgi:hypothetical protein